MTLSRRVRSATANRLFELEPAPPERFDLQLSPRAETVASYVLTAAAERSWQVLNSHLAAPTGGVFWIAGRPGCGKTHFLNYAIALQTRAGTLEAENAGRLICGFEAAGHVMATELEFFLLSVIAEQVNADRRALELWREMRGVEGLMVALESVRRIGVRSLTVAIDCGLSKTAALADFIDTLVQVAEKSTQLKFTVIAAGREHLRTSATLLEVAAADAREETIVAVRRSRKLRDDPAQIIDAYAGIENLGYEPQAIFPFHPASIDVLRAVAGPEPTIAGLAQIARAALTEANERVEIVRLVYPSDLAQTPGLDRLLEAQLGPSGTAALKIARAAVEHFDGAQRIIVREIVDAAMLHSLLASQRPALSIRELSAQTASLARFSSDEAWTMPMLREVLRQLEFHTSGIIRLEGDAVRFDPAAAGAPEVAAYNAALNVLQIFDSSLKPARDNSELQTRHRQLDQALSDAVEGANRTLAALSAALAEAHLDLPKEHLASIANFVALAEAGSAGLVALNSDPAQRESVQKVCDDYQALADAANAVPRMRSMRMYLAATGLRTDSSENSWQDAATAALETECELLSAELGPRLLTGAIRNINALEARFQKFKWTYVQRYREAHERWRVEMDRLAPIAEDTRRHADALARLDTIVALGAASAAELFGRVAELGASVVRCAPRHRPAPEITPRCTSCGFHLGAHSPREELFDMMERLRRALVAKLEALSQSVIARLIRQNDTDHRLDVLLKIIQAAQTDALVRVLDENLTRYLARVIDENLLSAIAKDDSGANPELIKRKPAASRRINSVNANRRDDR